MGVKTTRPSNKDTDKVKLVGGSQKATGSAVIELSDSDAGDASHVDQEPYVTPFLLEKKKRKIAPAPEDTASEVDSEVEQQLRRKASKKAPVKISADNSNKVR